MQTMIIEQGGVKFRVTVYTTVERMDAPSRDERPIVVLKAVEDGPKTVLQMRPLLGVSHSATYRILESMVTAGLLTKSWRERRHKRGVAQEAEYGKP